MKFVVGGIRLESVWLCVVYNKGAHTSQLRYLIVLTFKASSRFGSHGNKAFKVEEAHVNRWPPELALMGALESTT